MEARTRRPRFDPDYWLRNRSGGEFDEEDIGALAVPAPTAIELSESLLAHFSFLRDLDDEEKTLAHASEKDRALALRLLADLPGGRLGDIGLY